MPRTYRHIPQTDAQLGAWNTGRRWADEGRENVIFLAHGRADPGDWITADERKAWDRLGPEQWWSWAWTGYNARQTEDAE